MGRRIKGEASLGVVLGFTGMSFSEAFACLFIIVVSHFAAEPFCGSIAAIELKRTACHSTKISTNSAAKS